MAETKKTFQAMHKLGSSPSSQTLKQLMQNRGIGIGSFPLGNEVLHTLSKAKANQDSII